MKELSRLEHEVRTAQQRLTKVRAFADQMEKEPSRDEVAFIILHAGGYTWLAWPSDNGHWYWNHSKTAALSWGNWECFLENVLRGSLPVPTEAEVFYVRDRTVLRFGAPR